MVVAVVPNLWCARVSDGAEIVTVVVVVDIAIWCDARILRKLAASVSIAICITVICGELNVAVICIDITITVVVNTITDLGGIAVDGWVSVIAIALVLRKAIAIVIDIV